MIVGVAAAASSHVDHGPRLFTHGAIFISLLAEEQHKTYTNNKKRKHAPTSTKPPGP